VATPSDRDAAAGGSGAAVAAEAVHAALERILASAGFCQSERLSRFLRFAVEETLHGRGDQLKEYFLGVEVFDREECYDPRTDPIVRVEAGRLRSKLAKHYEAEGRADPVRIEFPKGSYVPVFRRRQPPERGPHLRAWGRALRRPTAIALLILAAVTGVALYFAVGLGREAESLRRELARLESARRDFVPLWGRLLASGASTTVVFGSPVFFASPQHNLFLRLMGINDPAQFRMDRGFQAMEQRLGPPLLGPRYDYALMGDALALQQLTAFFVHAGCNLRAVPADRAIWDDLRGGNILFLGAARMNPLLQRLPVQQDFELGPDNQIYNRRPQPGEDKVYVTGDHRDLTYAIIAHFPGLRPDREIMVLTAHSEPGILAAVGEVTRAESARALAEKLRRGPAGPSSYYQLLLRVAADRGVPVKTEYVTHHRVEGPALP
jgi:hypothetical protein